MSYTKFEAATAPATEPAKIRFDYTTDEIFNSVSLRSTYRANMTKLADGESQLDDIAISQDELDIVKEFLAESVYDIAAELFKITEGISLSVYVDTVLTDATLASNGFEIKDNAAFNANLLPSLDKKIENTIRYSILREWYASTGLLNDMKINQDMARANLIKVKNLTFQLRKPLMS